MNDATLQGLRNMHRNAAGEVTSKIVLDRASSAGRRGEWLYEARRLDADGRIVERVTGLTWAAACEFCALWRAS